MNKNFFNISDLSKEKILSILRTNEEIKCLK